jgi:uncharacterized repeat protein (TIGR03803 family)
MFRPNDIIGKFVVGGGLGLALAVSISASQVHAAVVLSVLHSFTGGSDGAEPEAGLFMDESGNLYGTTNLGGGADCVGDGCGTAFKIDVHESTFHAFQGGQTDGSFPAGDLVPDNLGNLYGTTQQGGGVGCNGYGCGTVFKLSPNGSVTLLHSFDGPDDGAGPLTGLVADAAGDLFGTTNSGGKTGSGCLGEGCGTVFELAADGTLKVLHFFAGGNDGGRPQGNLILDAAGNLYGTTSAGGAKGRGTIFELSPDGTETLLHVFQGGSQDGAFPYSNLIFDSAGNLYGTTSGGGRTCYKNEGCGTVFELSPPAIAGAVWQEKVLHFFTNARSTAKADGYYPFAGLVADGAGNLYGVTAQGGAPSGSSGCACGTIFKLAPDGTETVLHNFQGVNYGDGQFPTGTLILSRGNLYGTTQIGGSECAEGSCGVVFKLSLAN